MNKPRSMGRPDLTPNAQDDKIAAFIGQAPDERGAAAPAAAPAAAADQDDLPADVAKAKKPVKLTIQPKLLAEFDKEAARVGLSRAAAVGLAMRLWIDAEQAKRK